MTPRSSLAASGRRSLTLAAALATALATGLLAAGCNLPSAQSPTVRPPLHYTVGNQAQVDGPPVRHTAPATTEPATTAPATTAPATTVPTPVPSMAQSPVQPPAAPQGAPVPQPVADDRLCTQAQAIAFAHSLLDPYGIPVPNFTMQPAGSRSYYQTGIAVVQLATCNNRSSTAHEIGHYVMDRANGMDFQQHLADAAANFSGGNWIGGAETYPGVEYSAHCIGNQLWGNGPYTRCPDATMAAYARSVIQRA